MSGTDSHGPDNFRRIVERARSLSHDPLGTEIRKALRDYIERAEVVPIVGNQTYFDLLERRFPISVNRIDWSRVRKTKVMELKFEREGAVQAVSLRLCRQTLSEWAAEWGVLDESPAIYCGDDTHLALQMQWGTFLKALVEFVTLPQHGYVFPATCDWCIQLSIEGTVYGGRASDVTEVG